MLDISQDNRHCPLKLLFICTCYFRRVLLLQKAIPISALLQLPLTSGWYYFLISQMSIVNSCSQIWMSAFVAFRASARVLFRPLTSSPHKCRIPRPVTVSVRHVNRQAMPGSDHLRDYNIPYHTVQLVNEDGRLEPPTSLSRVITSIDSKNQFVELVSEDPKPLVKIKNKKEEYNKMKEWKRRQKEVAASNIQKEIQMTWGVESGDLEHKLKKVRKELERGTRVDLVYAPKTNQIIPSPTVMENRIKETVEMLSDIAKEWMPRRIEKGVAVLYLKLADKSVKSIKPS